MSILATNLNMDLAPCRPNQGTNRYLPSTNRETSFSMSTDSFIGMELSLVPEVECVIVERAESDRDFCVYTVMDVRDAEVRMKIYDREQAIMEFYPSLGFDFNIISRQKRDLSEIISHHGKLVFKRR
jgi:hypothetical protein